MFYLFYGGDSDDKEEGQTAGDWAGGGVNDELQDIKEQWGWGVEYQDWERNRQERGEAVKEDLFKIPEQT